jgi:uncharacterized membrane protein affecting hemolysin expression
MEFLKPGDGLSAIVVVLCLHLVVKIGQFLWAFKEKKDAVTESGIEELSKAVRECTSTIAALESRIRDIESVSNSIDKLRVDVRRAYLAIRLMAGDKWGDIRKIIMEEEPVA